MAEDSGAFKTNPRNSARFRHFVLTGSAVASKPHRIKKTFLSPARAYAPPNCNKRHRCLAVFSNRLIRCALAVPAARKRGEFCGHRVPDSSRAFVDIPRRRNSPFMLPSFRFLFAAIVFSMSILVFGLGAAALLRTAHEEFSSNPSWHATAETTLPQQSEPKGPVLALLRVDPQPAEQETPADVSPASVANEPAAIVPVAAEGENIAALRPENSSQPESAQPEIPLPESPAPSEIAPAQAEAAAVETRIAATEEASPPANEPAPTSSEDTSQPAVPEADAISAKIAALDPPTIAIEAKPPPEVANTKTISTEPDKSVIKKRQQARRAAQRRKIAARVRAARQAAQQAANPFAQPFTQPAAAQSR
jgi:hypothetical protein